MGWTIYAPRCSVDTFSYGASGDGKACIELLRGRGRAPAALASHTHTNVRQDSTADYMVHQGSHCCLKQQLILAHR
ncbi:hypothetical protein RRG08_054496 [Elysia crispata]|uniref:Uncharacterized protein n=1 Tax=Elysia crispata TaxID=231223 RepID=A0AAE0YTZ0_9GAST|nr:hypothetical protein RRG08_054496 [Elysia crispata]